MDHCDWVSLHDQSLSLTREQLQSNCRATVLLLPIHLSRNFRRPSQLSCRPKPVAPGSNSPIPAFRCVPALCTALLPLERPLKGSLHSTQVSRTYPCFPVASVLKTSISTYVKNLVRSFVNAGSEVREGRRGSLRSELFGQIRPREEHFVMCTCFNMDVDVVGIGNPWRWR